LASLYIPSYQITTSKVPVAFIFAPGKQILVRKLPAHSKYFVDPDWGLFEIKPEHVQFMNRTPCYFFDTRNQNPFSIPLMAELYKWAEHNKITTITRKHIFQGIKLRRNKKEAIEEVNKKDLEAMTIAIKSMQKEITQHNDRVEKIKEDDSGSELEGDSGELAPITEIQTNYLIIKHLATESYITDDDAVILEDKIKNKTMNFESLIDYLKGTKLMDVSQALPYGLDLVAQNFHTYEPRDAINVIKSLSKLNKGFKGLRTVKPKNWFPATYLLFGMVGIMMLLQFASGGIDLSGITGALNFGFP